MREAKLHLGLSLKDNPPPDLLLGSKDLDLWNPMSNGPDCPPGFENFQGMNGLSNKAQLHFGAMENFECDISLEDGNEDTHIFCASLGSSPNSAKEVHQFSVVSRVAPSKLCFCLKRI